MEYVGARQTLKYASTCRLNALERRWLIEHCALVDYQYVSELHERGINPQNVLAIPNTLRDLQTLPAIVGHVTFADSFNGLLLNAMLPPKLTHLTFAYEIVTLPPTLTHLQFGRRFDRMLNYATLPPTLTCVKFYRGYRYFLHNLPSHSVVVRK